ncbi:class I SAM-dependent methyltransferase [Ktedonosporobacter rubrisoli]|uniref:Class I SAM-dependent methyltransferase n=1 Tax=Ktedonosporobacter rubrisoli TaxID=2509675 RepID=A0A4V0Z0E7_KTERU|nr:class I SAM-dependent methyltransferase [Ktedonosporobacter rubrisoli]QBD82961.1 class I SAM-dependent methyltransferase [Ktedonosporobacter rubrisoli]
MHLFSFFQRKPQPLPFWEPTPTTSRMLGNRRFRTDLPYILPKDDVENSRLNYQHYAFKILLKSNHLAPIRVSHGDILDVGCGTAIWMLEMAREFPQARLVGLDTEFALPHGPVASNCRFIQGDIFRGLPFKEESFDYTHQRLMVLAVPRQRWPFVLSELVRVTRRDGWIELVEAGDNFSNSGPLMRNVLTWIRNILRPRGIDASAIGQIGTWLQGAGARNVQCYSVRCPLGKQGGHAGNLLSKDILACIAALRPHFINQLGLYPNVVDKTLAGLLYEWENYQTAEELFLAYGQK